MWDVFHSSRITVRFEDGRVRVDDLAEHRSWAFSLTEIRGVTTTSLENLRATTRDPDAYGGYSPWCGLLDVSLGNDVIERM